MPDNQSSNPPILQSSKPIPVNEPLLGGRELEYVTECIKTGWISSAGRFIEEFENAWASYCGMKYGIAVSNGTAALNAALACIDLKPGDQVIMPTFTIISCALAVIYNDAVPVLVDCDPKTWCMDVSQIEDKITDKTKAIMPVHIYGHPVDMDPLIELAERYDLDIIEDAAEAHGAQYLVQRNTPESAWKHCGGLGHISTFSFYANKLITTGEGGMILTNDENYAKKAASFRNLCFQGKQRFYHTELGHNFRMTNMQAAIGLAQLERMSEVVAKKRWMGAAYTERLKDIPGIQLPVEESWARQVYWMYGIVPNDDAGMDAVTLARRLKDMGVDTRPFFLGMHEQPVFRNMGLFNKETYPVAERLAKQGLYLPSGLTITEEQIEMVCDAVRKLI